MSQERVLITGVSGFLASSLAKELLGRGYIVRGLDITPFAPGEAVSGIEFITGDIRNKDLVSNSVKGMDYVIHAAAILPVSRSEKRLFWDVNVNGTRNVLEASLENRAQKVIFISSSAPYGIPREAPIKEGSLFNPVCAYGRSKIEAENICNEFRRQGLNIIILRPRTVVGGGRLGIFQILFSWITENKNIYIIGKGDNLYSLLSDRDLIDAVILALEKPCSGEDFNLGAEDFGTVREDLEGLIALVKSSSRVVALPALPAKLILRLLDLAGLVPFTPWHYLTPDKDFYFDISKARDVLGWRPKMSDLEALKSGYDHYFARRLSADSDYGITHKKSVRPRALKLLKRIS